MRTFHTQIINSYQWMNLPLSTRGNLLWAARNPQLRICSWFSKWAITSNGGLLLLHLNHLKEEHLRQCIERQVTMGIRLKGVGLCPHQSSNSRWASKGPYLRSNKASKPHPKSCRIKTSSSIAIALNHPSKVYLHTNRLTINSSSPQHSFSQQTHSNRSWIVPFLQFTQQTLRRVAPISSNNSPHMLVKASWVSSKASNILRILVVVHSYSIDKEEIAMCKKKEKLPLEVVDTFKNNNSRIGLVREALSTFRLRWSWINLFREL